MALGKGGFRRKVLEFTRIGASRFRLVQFFEVLLGLGALLVSELSAQSLFGNGF